MGRVTPVTEIMWDFIGFLLVAVPATLIVWAIQALA